MWKSSSFVTATFRKRPRLPTKAIAPKLSNTELIEEEYSPFYSSHSFRCTRTGEVLNGRYEIAAKLGWGARSTIWLARDLHQSRWTDDKYVTLKIQARRCDGGKPESSPEIEALKVITKANPDHPGYHSVRKLLDEFKIVETGAGKFISDCMAFEPMREPWSIYKRRFYSNKIIPGIVKVDARFILLGLDYLHSECQIIHTDININNILTGYERNYPINIIAEEEYNTPLPQKHLANGDIIYQSRNDAGPLRGFTSQCVIADFDGAIPGPGPHSGMSISTKPYEPPESMLDSGFSYGADIWSFGVLLLQILEGQHLFLQVPGTPADSMFEDTGELRLAYLTALLGPAPSDLIKAGSKSHLFYNSAGQLRNEQLIPSDFTFDKIVTTMSGDNKRLFINLIKRMLAWRLEDRSTAKDLAEDPWLHTTFIDEDTGYGYPAFYEDNPYAKPEGE